MFARAPVPELAGGLGRAMALAAEAPSSHNCQPWALAWLRSEVAAFRLETENPAEATRLRGEAEQAQAAMRLAAEEVEA